MTTDRLCRYGCRNTGLVFVPLVERDEEGILHRRYLVRDAGGTDRINWEPWPVPRPKMTTVLCMCGHSARWLKKGDKVDSPKLVDRLTLAQYEQQYNPGWRRQLHEVKLNELNAAYLACEKDSPFREIVVTQEHLLEHDGEDAERLAREATIPLRDLVHYARQHPAFRHHGTLNSAIVGDILGVWKTERKVRR